MRGLQRMYEEGLADGAADVGLVPEGDIRLRAAWYGCDGDDGVAAYRAGVADAVRIAVASRLAR